MLNLIYNTRASRHFFTNEELMQYFEDIVDDEYIYMKNSTTADK